MKAQILNRQFKHPEDGWYHIEPKGFHLNAAANVVQVIDDKAIASIVNRFNTAASAGDLRHGSEMLIDHEHFKHDADKETRAFGWAESMKARSDGIYAQNRWTATGKPAVDGGDYRFFSTEYDLDDPKNFEEVPASELPANIRSRYKGVKFIRPLVITGLTLTNEPNNRGQRPATNRDKTLQDDPAKERSGAASPTGVQVDNPKTQSMKQIAIRYGLSADASEEAILGEHTKLENRATTAEASLKEVTKDRDTIKNRMTTLEGEAADALLDAHGIKADDTDRPALKEGLIYNREAGLAFLKRIAKPATEKKPLTNRSGAKTPGEAAEGEAADEAALATKIQNRAKELKGISNRSFNDCWNQAKQELTATK